MVDLSFLAILHTWYTNFTTQVSTAISNLTVRDYIRLVWIIGGYLFLRPYLDKGFRKVFEKGTEKADREEAEARSAADQANGAKLSANALHGEREDGDSEDEDSNSTAVMQWGKSARRKQRKFVEFLEQEAEKRREDDDDKDIADLLED